MGETIEGFTTEAREALSRYAWPGNLRELRNAVERAAILAAGPEVGLRGPPRADRWHLVAGCAAGVQVGQPMSPRAASRSSTSG